MLTKLSQTEDTTGMENPTTGHCKTCSQDFVYDAYVFLDGKILEQTHCEDCIQKEAEERRHQEEAAQLEIIRQRIERKWNSLAPERFRDSDVEYPEFRKGLLMRALKWFPERTKPWLGIVGKKGCCKTRVALLRTHEAIKVKPSADFLFVPIYDFAAAVQAQYDDDREIKKQARELLADARKADWLVLDDIGKARATPAVVAALFALLDHRHAHNLATVWTANSMPEEFCNGMAEDVAGPIMRRLLESSELIGVK